MEGKIRPPKEGERYFALLKVNKINFEPPENAKNKVLFENLTPLFANQRLKMEIGNGATEDITARIVDLVSPIGKGQRGMLVSPPKAGKTMMLQNIAQSIAGKHPECYLIVVLMDERPTPASVFEVLRREQPTLFFGVPTLYAAMLADAGCAAEAGSARLRLCISAGEALPEHVGKAWEARFGVPILDGIGSTEMLHIFISNQPGRVRYGTSGMPVAGYEARLVDEHGGEPPEGEVGELLVRGPSAADGYWNQRDKSRRTFEGEWTRTGDKYTRDREGYYTYCGRTDDMFKVSGIWVSPFEVESALMSHQAVLEAAVVPQEDGDGLLKPKAFVVLNEKGMGGAGLEQELKDHVKTSVGNWKYPRWFEFVETLPKTATGKIQRYKLREPQE